MNRKYVTIDKKKYFPLFLYFKSRHNECLNVQIYLFCIFTPAAYWVLVR